MKIVELTKLDLKAFCKKSLCLLLSTLYWYYHLGLLMIYLFLLL